MTAIGVRVETNQLHFAIATRDNDEAISIKAQDEIRVPQALDLPDALHHVRSMFIDVIHLYDVHRGGIRTVEGSAQNVSSKRIGIEAVIQEAIAGSPVEKYFAGTLATIAKWLPGDFNNNALKAEIAANKSTLNIEGWSAITAPKREALLAAIAALEV